MNVPDYPLEETIDFKFTSRAFATGIPTTLAGTPAVEIYEDNSVTQITAAETLTVDFDSVTGLNNLRVVATAANGFESGKSYQAVISAGTVGGVSVVGEVVAQFSIERSPALRPTTAGRTLDVTATGAAGIDWANVENPTTAVDLSATDIQLCDTTTTLTNTVTLADGAHGGSSASFAFGAGGTINSASGDALALTSSGGNGSGLSATGTGTGHGVKATGGSGLNASGIYAIGDGTLGVGLNVSGVFAGLSCSVSSSGVNGFGANITGKGTGHGASFVSGAGATGDAANFSASSTDGNGIGSTGAGDGHGMQLTSGSGLESSGLRSTAAGAAGAGIDGRGPIGIHGNGTLSGFWVCGTSGSDGVGCVMVGAGTGQGAYIRSGLGATGNAVEISPQSTNGNGLVVTGSGTGAEILADITGTVSGNTRPIATGTAQSGTASTIVLAAASSFANDILNGCDISILSGTGAGQTRVIYDYDLATDTATITPNWTTNPSSDSVYQIGPASVNLTAAGGAPATGLSTVDANMVQISGDSTAADNMESAFDGTGYGFTSCTMPTTTTLTNWHASVTDWTDGGRLDLILDAILDDTDLIDDATSGLAKIATDVAAVLVDTGTTIPGTITTMQGNVTDILADTNELQTDDIPTTLATLATAAALSTHDGKLDTLDTLVDRMAPLLVGTVTGAGTGTEVYVYGGVTATVTVDASGNVSGVVFS